MIENLDLSLVDWSRAQFALTAMYHWIFVPLTLGMAFIIAIMETIYVKTNDPAWKKTTKLWMTLFGINFAIGVATGIILEFEFGTNWSNYSWFVGDIFGAPLAIEGIMAFFMESTFIAVMFFGWNKVSKKSIMVFPPDTKESLIRMHWKYSYKTCDISQRLPGSDIKSHKTIYHYFKRDV